MTIDTRALLGSIILAAIATPTLADPTFTLIPQIEDSTFGFGKGISADGTQVAGTGRPAGINRAFIWNATDGAVEIFGPAGSTRSNAFAISGAGDTVVGSYATPAHNSAQNSPFMWTKSGGSIPLPLLPGASSFVGSANGLSGDGHIALGQLRNSTNQGRAVYWKDGGAPVDLGLGTAIAASWDGSIITGIEPLNGNKTFLWTESTGVTILNPPAFFQSNSPAGISQDGSVVVGTMNSTVYGKFAYRWTQATGMVALPYLAGWEAAEASAVSADGSVIVGRLTPADISDPDPDQAFYWTQATGMVTLRSMLGESVDDDWRLIDVTGLSADGLSVEGTAYNDLTGERRAYHATIPTPSSLLLPSLALLGQSVRRRRR